MLEARGQNQTAPSGSDERMTRRAQWLLLAALVLSSCSRPEVRAADEAFDCRGKRSQPLALSHLKEADLKLQDPSVRGALHALSLTSRGLACAPPRGRAEAWTVARLLVVRARASTEIDRPDDALSDLLAARKWAAQGPTGDPLLVPEIHLATARAYLRRLEHNEALSQVDLALGGARGAGAASATLQCEALLLKGDILGRLRPSDDAPKDYYRQVFKVAERYQYPETTWDYLDSALARLAPASSTEAARLLGPIPELRAAKVADEKEIRVLKQRDASGSGNMARVSHGNIPGADQTIAAMRAGFRLCFQKRLSVGANASGKTILTISVGASGAVENVEARSQQMDSSLVDCLADEARRARFDPPRTNHAVLEVPVTLVQQE